MQNTNVNRSAGEPATKAHTVPATRDQVSTAASFNSGQRTVSVNTTSGEILLRYVPVNPKPAPQQTR